MGILMFALFTSIAMTVGILIVYFTSPKASKTCQLSFKRMMKSTISVSSQPRCVAVGDFNNDHQMDMVVVSSGTNNIGIFLSNINGNFENQQTYSTGSGSQPYSITASDFNNDNHLDIAIANYGTNNIGIFVGYGNGTFGSQKVFSTGSSRPFFITTGDFNKDNQSDIAIVHYGTDSIGILLGNGDGSFAIQTTYSTGYDSLPYSLAVGHFNNDNLLDIAVANYGTSNIGIFLGYDNETFSSQKTYTTTRNSNPSSIAIEDFNNDKKLDIVVANYGTGSIDILIGHGNGTFVTQATYSMSSKSHPQFISVGYFDKDNYLDVAVVDSEYDRIHFLPGFGNGSFSTVATYDAIADSRPFGITVTDFNNSNQSDIVIANYDTNNVLVLTGYYSKPSARQVNYLVGRVSRPTSVAIGNLNNDNYGDIVVNNFNGDSILILIGYNNGTFKKTATYSTGIKFAPQSVYLIDLNHDNQLDIVTANLGSGSVGVLLGFGNGTFTPVTNYPIANGSMPFLVTAADVNNDAQLDLISANAAIDNVGVFLGYGNGTFANVVMYSSGINSGPWSVVAIDVNNDNCVDIITANHGSNSISVLLGYGTGTFGLFTIYSTGTMSQPTSIAFADFSGDNQLDIVVTNSGNDNVGLFIGYGNGTFGNQRTYFTGTSSFPYSVAVTDYNNDNRYDIAVANIARDEVVVLFGDGIGNLKLERTFSTGLGSSPYGIAVADVNNDKQLEILVTFWGSGEMGVLSEYYAAEFTYQTTYSTGSAPHPYSLAVDDCNSDNRSDIVVVNSDTDSLGILVGMGNGTFGVQTKYPIDTDSYPQYVITGVINKDFNLGIVTANSKSNTISIIMAYGNGTFASQLMYSTGDGSKPYAVAFGDFNKDNRSDLVVANAGTDSIGIFVGFDYATFQSQETYSAVDNSLPWEVVVSDFNNDNYLDIAVVFSTSDNLAILLGDGNGSFTNAMVYSTRSGSNSFGLVVDDFNKDNIMDIAIANIDTNNVGVLLGYGNGSFAPMVTYTTGNSFHPNAVAVGDFNNDGRLDIAVGHIGTANIAVLLGYNNGSFYTLITYFKEFTPLSLSIAVGDFNNDGRLDIASVHRSIQTLSVFLGYGNGTFAIPVTYITGYYSEPVWVAVGDFNSDHYHDIATANNNHNNVGTFLGYGNGTFAHVVPYSTGDGSGPKCIRVGDFNNDNHLDIGVANSLGGNVVVLFGFGDGTFLLGKVYATGRGATPNSLAIGDFNKDNRLDIVVGNDVSNNIVVFLGYGREPFAGITKYTTGDGSQPHSVAVGDLNSDGQADVVVANYGTDSVGILFGFGNGLFDNMITYSTGVGSAPYSVAIADFNNDNRSDIVVTNSETNNVAIFLVYGNGTFAIPLVYSTGARSRPYTVAIGDFNNDNKLDLVIANSGTNNIFLLYGYENGTFGNEASYALGYEYSPYSVAITDLNQDGWMDIVIACYGTDNIETLVKAC